MTDRVHYHPDLIFPAGSRVVALVNVHGSEGRIQHPRGAVGVIVRAPTDHHHAYRVRFPDGFEAPLKRQELDLLARSLEGDIADNEIVAAQHNLYDRVFFRCVIGSQAYGLAGEASDVDRRGIYLPPAELQWSLYGIPDQLENHATQEHYWELQRFLVLALKANPNVLECLFTPLVEKATPLAEELLVMRRMFVTKLVYQTYNGYVVSQFRKIQADLRNQGEVKWKHVMHLLRLLLAGVDALKTGEVPVDVGEQRERLLAVRRGEMLWDDVEAWRLSLHNDFRAAYDQTRLPERPDYQQANAFLISARKRALAEELP
jgi:predicted nucleotidyltransferase